MDSSSPLKMKKPETQTFSLGLRFFVLIYAKTHVYTLVRTSFYFRQSFTAHQPEASRFSRTAKP